MNDEKHLRELLQAVLDGKILQYHGHGKNSGWADCRNKEYFEHTIRSILTNGANEYRIKPEVKTFTYQTRLFFCSGRVKIWSNFSDVRNQIELEKDCNVYSDFKWLAPAQTHTIEYTE
jgi:hypothetical protein